jgi:hypothetical protein
MTKKRISIASAKQKGRKFQQWVRDKLRAAYPQLEEGDIESCPMGSSGSDIILSPLAKRTIGLDIECKARATGFTQFYDYLDQAKAGGSGLQCIAVVKQDRKHPLVVIDAEEFFSIWANRSYNLNNDNPPRPVA